MRLSHSPTGEIVAKKYFKALEKGRRLSWTEVTAEPTFLILDSVSVFNGHTPVRQSCYTRSSLNSSELCQITHKAWKSRRRAPNHVTELRDYRKFQVSAPNLHFEHWHYRIHNRTALFRNRCKTRADILCGVRLELRNLTSDHLSEKLLHQLFLPWGTFTPILIFLCFFVFDSGVCTGQTDGQEP